MSRFHELTMNDVKGQPVPFKNYVGSHCLIVNVASR